MKLIHESSPLGRLRAKGGDDLPALLMIFGALAGLYFGSALFQGIMDGIACSIHGEPYETGNGGIDCHMLMDWMGDE